MRHRRAAETIAVMAWVCVWGQAAAQAAPDPRLDPKALSTVKAMSEYVGGIKSFRFKTQETVDGVGESECLRVKLQYASMCTVATERPDYCKPHSVV